MKVYINRHKSVWLQITVPISKFKIRCLRSFWDQIPRVLSIRNTVWQLENLGQKNELPNVNPAATPRGQCGLIHYFPSRNWLAKNCKLNEIDRLKMTQDKIPLTFLAKLSHRTFNAQLSQKKETTQISLSTSSKTAKLSIFLCQTLKLDFKKETAKRPSRVWNNLEFQFWIISPN